MKRMKKIFIFSMLFAATVCNAQVVLWDGTDKEAGSDGAAGATSTTMQHCPSVMLTSRPCAA